MAQGTYRGGYPWALGAVVAQRPGSERGNAGIRVFSARGLSAPGTLGTSPLPQIGTLIPGTPYVYIRPRLSQDPLGGSGGSPFVGYRWPGEAGMAAPGPNINPNAIRYTNPEFSMYRERRRTPSIGMARGLQQGATMAVPYESNAPYFSIA